MGRRTATITALRAALLFALLSTLWITLSDQLLVGLVGDNPATLARWSTGKGIAYTLAVAWAIFALVRRDCRVIADANQAVEQGHEHLHMLLNSMPQAVMVLDRQGRIRFVNDGAVTLYGYSAEALLQMTVDQLTTPEYRTKFSQFIHAAQQGKPFEAQTIDVRQSGETFDAGIHAVPIRWNDRPCMLVSITEVSRQRRLERELHESAHQYTQLTQNSRDLIIRCTKDAYVLSANVATLEMLGCTSSAALCRPLGELDLDRTTLTTLQAAIQQTFATSQSTSCTTRLEARQGMRQVDWQIVPEFGQEDHVRGVLLVGRDLTDQIAMQTKLGTSEQSLKAILERVHGGMWSYFPADERLVIDNNLHRLLEWQGEETLIGVGPFNQQHHPSDLQAVTGRLNAVIEGTCDTLDSVHRVRRHRTGDWVWIHTWGYCSQRDADGKAAEIIGVAFDITRQRTSEVGNDFLVRLLNRLVENGGRKELVRDILAMIKRFTTVDAVAIRLQEGDDYPYYVYDGLSDEMVEKENFLCPRTDELSPAAAADADIPACLCGRVILGKVDSRLPYYTKGGSFLASLDESFEPDPREQPGLSLRGTCMSEGYKSIALIPLRNHHSTIGLVQLLDRRPEAITEATVAMLELAASAMGLAITART